MPDRIHHFPDARPSARIHGSDRRRPMRLRKVSTGRWAPVSTCLGYAAWLFLFATMPGCSEEESAETEAIVTTVEEPDAGPGRTSREGASGRSDRASGRTGSRVQSATLGDGRPAGVVDSSRSGDVGSGEGSNGAGAAVADPGGGPSGPVSPDDDPRRLGPFTEPYPLPSDARLAAAGLRRIQGRHLVLVTDLGAAPEVDGLVAVFDRAVPAWCQWFGVPEERSEGWIVHGFLMNDRLPFTATELLPDTLPPFLHGFQRGATLWLHEQPTAYYRRHLMLHEGTHAFMEAFLGGGGPPWYMEGIAELLGTHRWQEGDLQLGIFPRDREAVDHWGRIKIVQDEYAAGRGRSIPEVFAYGRSAHLDVQPYGWCWALCAFLDGHPRYRDDFRSLIPLVRDPQFTERFEHLLSRDGRAVAEEWQLFVVNLEYGYDLEREAVEYRPVERLPPGGAELQVKAERGWQSTGYEVVSGHRYRVEATGRFQLRQDPRVWWSEANGVTIRYHRGRPLGQLQAAINNELEPLDGMTPLVQPWEIGVRRTWTASESGTLFLRINDSPAERYDNEGWLDVRIQEVADETP